jgi:hypothetical protein
MSQKQNQEQKIVPLSGTINISTGILLRAIYPNMSMWQRGIIKLFLLLEKIKSL